MHHPAADLLAHHQGLHPRLLHHYQIYLQQVHLVVNGRTRVQHRHEAHHAWAAFGRGQRQGLTKSLVVGGRPVDVLDVGFNVLPEGLAAVLQLLSVDEQEVGYLGDDLAGVQKRALRGLGLELAELEQGAPLLLVGGRGEAAVGDHLVF